MSKSVHDFELQDGNRFYEVSLKEEAKKQASSKKGIVYEYRIWMIIIAFIGVLALVGVVIGVAASSSGDVIFIDEDVVITPNKNKGTHHNVVKIAEAAKEQINSRLSTTKTEDGKLICTTAECAETANNLINSMNTSVDPCYDFYEFACGGWIASHPIVDNVSQSTFDADDIVLQARLTTILESDPATNDPIPLVDMRTFYDTCLDTDTMDKVGLQPLTYQLGRQGGWPMTVDSWDSSKFTIEEAISGVQKLQVMPLVSVGDDADFLNTSYKILYVQEGMLGLDPVFLLNSTVFSKQIDAYKKYIGDSAKLIRDSLENEVSDESIESEVNEIVEFEIKLAQLMNDADFYNYTDALQLMDIAGLQALFDSGAPDQFNWLDYFHTLFAGSGVIIESSEPVYVYIGSYLPELSKLMDETSDRVLANYLGWFWTMVTGPETTYDMRKVSQTFKETVYGTPPDIDRTQHCVDQVNYNLGFATSRAYVDEYFPVSAKDEVTLLVVRIKDAFHQVINKTDWMLEEDKNRAMEKLDYVERNVAYPDWILDDVVLQSAYDGLNVQSGKQYENLMSLADLYRDTDVSTFRDPPMTAFGSLGMPPTVVNAYYTVFSNSINILVGILQKPFYSHNTLYSINFGAIGTVVGHEFTHGFDNNGRRFDKYGDYDVWWDETTTNNFVNKSQCFVDQYDQYSPPELIGTDFENMTLDGQQTLGENIADNGGIHEAYRAYRKLIDDIGEGEEPSLPGLKKYTNDQLFFLNFANVYCNHFTTKSLVSQIQSDPHSNGRFRTIGTVSNDVDFRNTWKCDVSTPMNRGDDSCVLW